MKILQVVKLYSPWIGGVEKVAQDIAEGLSGKESLGVDVLCCQAAGRGKIEKINEIKVYRASSLGIFRGMPISIDFLLKFHQLVKSYDVIDIHQPFPLADLAIFLFKPKTRIVVHYHSDIARQRLLKYLATPLAVNTLRRAESIIVSNPNTLDNSDYLRNFRAKCIVIPFGIDLPAIERQQDQALIRDLRDKYGKYVLYVGRLAYYKGIDYLIKAMKDVSATLIVIGQGDLESKLKAQSKRLGLTSKVVFLGDMPTNLVINYMSAASVFVLPSTYRTEAFGLVLIEAMACGTPIISTELGTGTSWINQDGTTGYVVSPRNAGQIAAKVKLIIKNSSLRDGLGKAAQERAKADFTKSKYERSMLELYHSK